MEGEFDLIARLTADLAEPGGRVRVGVGDDAAVTVPGGATATSVDALVEGVHFRRETSPLRSIGFKALAAALSDLAAMGAEPGEAYVILGVPPGLSAGDCEEVYAGLRAIAAETGTVLAGGDVTRSPSLTLAVTAVGHAPTPDALVRRAGAGAGETVVLTGELGGAAAGLVLLERGDLAGSVPDDVAAALIARQREPRPRLAEGAALATAGATAMIDVSDGLGADAGHLAASGGVLIEVELGRLPLAAGLAEVAEAAGIDPLDLAAGGGEDYELLACLPSSEVAAARERVTAGGGRLTAIGEVRPGDGVGLIDPEGGRRSPSGYDQLGEGRFRQAGG